MVEWREILTTSCAIKLNHHHQKKALLMLNAPIRLWLQLTKSIVRDVANPVMISISSAVYKYMLQKVRALSVGEYESQSSVTISESDNVYLRFGGGHLASMYKSRYSAMKSKGSSAKKDPVSHELQVTG